MTTHHDPRACDCTLHTATPQVCPDPLDEEALFWHERWHEAADQRDARDHAAQLWKETARRLAIRVRSMNAVNKAWDANFTAAIKQREDAWEQLEHRDRELATAEAQRDEAQRLAAEQIAEAQTEATEAVTRAETAELRAEKAEQERDEADRRTAEAEEQRDRWKRHHDRVDRQWAKAEREVTRLRAEQSRPLTPDDITEDQLDRAQEAWETSDQSEDVRVTLRQVLTAALTEPPTRPEWEQVESLLREMPPGTVTQGSKWLVERGVRVTGGEDA